MTREEYDAFIVNLKTMDHDKALESLLANIAMIQPQMMLQDLLFGDRTPALFNAVTALLKYHKIELDPLAAAQRSHPVGALAHGLPPKDYLSGDEYGSKH